jgi:hypothetical protein
MLATAEAARLVDIDPGVLDELLRRISAPDYATWERQVHCTGACQRPVRLQGTIHRNGDAILDTNELPDGVLLKACGNRRASVCPSCSYLYRGDTWQLLNAGMVGGKGVPETIAEHPAAFITLTAPSFGPVHGLRGGKPCRPRDKAELCPHGRPTWCRRRHHPDDEQLGQPLCDDCYDHAGHVLFNWWAPELWRRFTITLARHLARRLGLPVGQHHKWVRLSFAKVAEFQKRGVVHFHALLRLDARTDDGEHHPPAVHIDFADLEAAVRSAAASVGYGATEHDDQAVLLRFGSQVDVRAVNTGIDGELTGRAVAAYISKYATKAAEDARLDPTKRPPAHVLRLLRTGRQLAQAVPELQLMARWEHMLFFRGHFSTKSRRYSTTLGALRRARTEHQRRADRIARGLDPDDEDDTTLVIDLTYAGQGYSTRGDALLAASIAARTREGRELAREAGH